MAKEKKKKEKKEKPPKSGPGIFSKISLPLVLIPVLLLAGASFFALGILKQKAKSEAESAKIDNRVALKIDDLPPPAFQKPPPTLPSNMSQTDIQPVVAGTDTSVQPAGGGAATPAPGVPPVAGPMQTPMAVPAGQAQPGGNVQPVVKTESPAPGIPQVPSQPLSGAPAASSPGTSPQGDESGPIKPMWQTVDQQWDDVIVEPAQSEAVGATSAAWRSINVGQSDDVTDQVAESPVMGTALTRPAAAKPSMDKKEVPAAKAASPKRAKPPVKKYAGSRPKKKTSRIPTVAIINESGAPQAGQFYRDVLSAMSSSIGIRVGPIQNAPARSGPTTIFYKAGMKAKAQTLSRRIPGNKVLSPLPNKADHDILVVVRSR